MVRRYPPWKSDKSPTMGMWDVGDPANNSHRVERDVIGASFSGRFLKNRAALWYVLSIFIQWIFRAGARLLLSAAS